MSKKATKGTGLLGSTKTVNQQHFAELKRGRGKQKVSRVARHVGEAPTFRRVFSGSSISKSFHEKAG
jgi:hypothetical protein